MSSILKALEKAEESSNPRRLANDSGVIRSNKSRPGWVTPVAVLCAAGVAALVTYGAMGGFSKKPAHPAGAVAKTGPVVVAPLRPVPETVQVPEQVVQPEQPNQAKGSQANGSQASGSQASQAAPAATEPAAAAPPAAAAAPKAKAAPAAPPRSLAVPVKIAPPTNANAVVPVKKVVPVSGAKAVAPKLGASQPVAVQPTALQASPRVAAPAPAPVAAPAPAPAPAKAAAVAPAASSAPARAQLKVSGIAYQDNGEASFAVVNGRAVLQGGSVDGYKVLEIRHDSVKFSGGNSTFEIPLEVEEK